MRTNEQTFNMEFQKLCSCRVLAYGVRERHIWKNLGQVDSTESSETPEITEITESTENFVKVAKYLTKLKETVINYGWEKSHLKKH